MTTSTLRAKTLRIGLAMLVLVPTLLLATSAGSAKAATWTTVGSAWSTGAKPGVAATGSTRANPRSLRLQVTNHIATSRSIEVSWTRDCRERDGDILHRQGRYTVEVGGGKTSSRTLFVPKTAVKCDLYASALVMTPKGGKMTLRLQAAY